MVLERRGAGAMLVLTILFILSACGLLAFKDGAFDVGTAAFGIGAALLMLLGWLARHPYGWQDGLNEIRARLSGFLYRR